jgi:hypothetical protein
MQTNSYKEIKSFIFKKLQEVKGTLPANKIKDEIRNTQGIISNIGLEMFAKVLSIDVLEPLSNADWEEMQRELETDFNVKV